MYAQKIVLHFPHDLVDKPILYKLSKDYDLEFNILRASVTPNEEGVMVLELKGDEKKYQEALGYLQKEGVVVKTLAQDVTRDDKKCVSCGLCVTICPVSAFEVITNTREVVFKQDKCIACQACVLICPYKAMEVKV